MPSGRSQNFWSWLGRQVGHVRKAIHADVSAELAKPGDVVYRQDRVEEKPMPNDPTLKLRRTTIDEVIAKPKEPPKSES